MRNEILTYIKSKNDLHKFIREEPAWYQKLSRNPWVLKEFENAALKHYKKTIPDRVEQVSTGMQMAAMMFSMLQAMNKSD